jgi:hypothetical protein
MGHGKHRASSNDEAVRLHGYKRNNAMDVAASKVCVSPKAADEHELVDKVSKRLHVCICTRLHA